MNHIQNEKEAVAVSGCEMSDDNDIEVPARQSKKNLIKQNSKTTRGTRRVQKYAMLKQHIDAQNKFQDKQNEFYSDVVDVLNNINNTLIQQNKINSEHKMAELALRREEMEAKKLELEIARTANELKLMELDAMKKM